MKTGIIFSSWLLMFIGAFGMSESLQKLIESVNGKEDGEFGYDQRMIAAWPGLESETALDEILDLVLQPGRNENYPEGMDILRSMRFSREQIVGMILEKIEKRQTPEDGLGRAFGLAQYYTDDPRILSYLINFLNDTRPAGRRAPMTTADYGSVAERICDVAADVIREGLQKRGLLKPGDPAWGESGGATSYENADSALLLLKEFLVRNQMMTEEQAFVRPKKDTTKIDPLTNLPSESKSQVREPKRSNPVVESTKPVSFGIWILVGTLAATGIVFWTCMKRHN